MGFDKGLENYKGFGVFVKFKNHVTARPRAVTLCTLGRQMLVFTLDLKYKYFSYPSYTSQ